MWCYLLFALILKTHLLTENKMLLCVKTKIQFNTVELTASKLFTKYNFHA